MAFLTVAEFLARLDAQDARDLSAAQGAEEPDETRIGASLDDATAELDGYLMLLPAGRRPSEATLGLHCFKVALYLLTLNRPGKDFEQIRNAYNDTIAYYTRIIERSGGASTPIGGTADAPEPRFNDRTLKGLV